MALRQEYMLGHSEFNDFLYAPVGEEKNGQQVSVLSVLARLGLDPWGEAARLSGLTREAAAGSLATLIDRLPEGAWPAADTPSIAARLVASLPRSRPKPEADVPDSAAAPAKPGVDLMKWLTLAALAAVAGMYLMELFAK